MQKNIRFAAWIPLACVCLSLAAAAATLPYRVVVEKEGAEDGPLGQVESSLVEASVAPALAGSALKGFDRYIDERVEKQNKKVTLYPQVVFDLVKATAAQSWSGSDIGALLEHIQREIDDEQRSPTRMKGVVLEQVTKKKSLKEVLAALEASEGDEDEDDD